MSDVVISVKSLAKQYRLGMVGAGTLREDIVGWWYKIRGKEDPYSKLGETNVRSSTGSSDYVWALKDVSFEVKKGEVLGIIGKNGAGKSTLLKLLSRVTAPTSGEIRANGRIASLLEVGTGFHPELTGRENIFLNGAIMGMRKSEINAKLDEIIEFAGVQRYIDTPVKRYSSGMYVRLAFAVAAHLEPEILIVDEVLAVGDAEFQKKAIGKMQDVSSGQGRTVLFVSLNMKAVESLCTRGILVEDGRIVFEGTAKETVNAYLKSDQIATNLEYVPHDVILGEGVSVLSGRVVNELPIFMSDDVNISFTLRFEKTVEFHLNIHVISEEQLHLFQSGCQPFTAEVDCMYEVNFTIPKNLLNERMHSITLSMVKNRSKTFLTIEKVLGFKVESDINIEKLNWFGKTPGLLKPIVSSSVNMLK